MRSPPPVRSAHAVGALMQIWAEGSGFEGIGGLHGWARALVLPAFAHRRFALSDEPSPSAPAEAAHITRLAEPLGLVAPVGEEPKDMPAVLLVSRGEGELDLGPRHGKIHPLAVMLDREDVHAFLGDQAEELGELAGPVLEPRPDDEEPARPRERVPRHLDEEARVDVPAREQRARRPVALDL